MPCFQIPNPAKHIMTKYRRSISIFYFLMLVKKDSNLAKFRVKISKIPRLITKIHDFRVNISHNIFISQVFPSLWPVDMIQ